MKEIIQLKQRKMLTAQEFDFFGNHTIQGYYS